MDADEGGVSIKQVKLKVLYTFDSEHKNNHLARWPQTLEVQTAQLDESSTIGVIGLRTCLEAVTTASPELTNIDNEYTIYAYDYSEEDTPLVGQGMLSKALSEDSNGDAENEAMVTGRITKNVMGLFSKNAQETLEVKLRFTPVTSGFRRRSGSICSNGDNIQQQWHSLSQTNGAFRPLSPMNTSGLETMQKMLSEGGPKQVSYQNESFYQASSRPTSRSGTPVQSQSHGPGRQSTSESRPSSRAGPRQRTHARRDSFNSGYYSAEEIIEEGPVKKRAKIQRADPSKADLNIERQPDSLRVAASTASSVRLHRPVPQHPGIAALQHGSPPMMEAIRPPTPIPQDKPKRARGRPKKVISPNLLKGHQARRSSPARQQQDPDMAVSSPEDGRAGSATSTPADIPSSPPVMPEEHNLVTSPALPPMVNDADSGFMSGNLDDLFDGQLLDFGDYFTDQPQQDQLGGEFAGNELVAADMVASYPQAVPQEQNLQMLPPIDAAQSNQVQPAPNSQRSLQRARSFTPGLRTLVPAPRLAPALTPGNGHTDNRRAHTVLPQIPASDPVERTFQRSQTWAPSMSDAIMSDAGQNGTGDGTQQKSSKRVGKEQTKARLENAIAAGQMPPYCDNCGAIETPAWRRAYTKIFDTTFQDFETSLNAGECCYKEPQEQDTNGKIVTWRGYRTEKKPGEKTAEDGGWTQINLCNPCGLWFHKSKYPRPPEKWQKRDPNDKKKRKRKPKKSVYRARPGPKSDAATPASDDSSPAETSAEGGDGEDFDDSATNSGEANDDNEPQLPPIPPRAGSAEPGPRGLTFATARLAADRQVKSSPIRANPAAPVEITLTPKPLRRQLFPSPDSLRAQAAALQARAPQSESYLPTFVRRSPRLHKTRDVFAGQLEASAMVAIGGDGKENVAPATSTLPDADFEELFGGAAADEPMLPPSTPTPKRRSERILMKTPGRTPSREFGSSLSPNAHLKSPSAMRTPKHKLHPAASILLNTVQRNLDPVEMTPFTRSIHMAFSADQAQTQDHPSTPHGGRSYCSRRTPKRCTPKGVGSSGIFDLPDLPPLKGSSPLSNDPNFMVDFSEMTTDRLHTDFTEYLRTDGPMPSSPPKGIFDLINTDSDCLQAMWDTMLDNHNKPARLEVNDHGFNMKTGHSPSPRRSPRKHAT